MTTDIPLGKSLIDETTPAGDEDDEELRAIGMKEVDDEMMVFPPEKDYLEHLSPIGVAFRSPLLEYEHSFLESGKARPDSSGLASIQVDAAPFLNSVIDEDQEESLSKCLNLVKIKLEYRQRQLDNLELIKSYGSHAWQEYISEYKMMESDLNKELDNLSRRAQEVKGAGGNDYESTLEEMDMLKKEWNAFVDKNRLLIHEMKDISSDT